MNKILITLALLGAQETSTDEQVCFRKCEIKDTWGVIHHDYVKKYDSYEQFLSTNPPKDTWICVDDNVWGTKIFRRLKRHLKKDLISKHNTNKN